MRKEMKKGRLLISSLEESRQKFIKKEQGEIRKERKGPFMPADLSKMRPGVRSSQAYMEYLNSTGSGSIEPTIRQSQTRLLSPDQYSSLEGLEVDTLAMKITTFKRR
jgi:hypothetical protein